MDKLQRLTLLESRKFLLNFLAEYKEKNDVIKMVALIPRVLS